jgi:NitT/TauT family transport system substrate-binding protein
MKRRHWLALALALGAGAAGPLAAARRAGAQELPKILVAGPPIDDFKTVYYGMRSGLFHKYGVDVNAQAVNSGAAALAGLIGNSVQVAFTSVPAVLQGFARGVGFRVVAPAQWYLSEAATSALFVKANAPIKSGRDLNGKTVAVQSLKDLNWAVTLAWIDSTGGDSKTVKVVELPNSAVLPAIEDGRVDAGSLASPFLEQGMSSTKVKFLAKNYDAVAKRFQASVFVSTADYIAANTDAMSKFVHAMHDSIVYTNTHLAETVPLVASYTGVEPAVVARSVRAIDPEYIDPKDLQPVIDVEFRYKVIDRTFNADDVISSIALRRPR